jgi:hypothetical protein
MYTGPIGPTGHKNAGSAAGRRIAREGRGRFNAAKAFLTGSS